VKIIVLEQARECRLGAFQADQFQCLAQEASDMLTNLVKWLTGPAKAGKASMQPPHNALLNSLLVMAWFVESRDPYTGGHLWRVSRFAKILSEALQLPVAEVARISLGGFLHDLGKIGIPDAILRKPTALTEEEYALMRTHPEIGWRMLAGHPLAGLVKEAVYSHHERPDGLGYPRNLTHHEIPLAARIVGICDAFDAMTSSRPYRLGMSRGRALDIIQSQSGKQFDSLLCERFIALGRAGLLDPVIGHSDDGIPLQECPMCGPTLVIRREQQSGEHIFCRNCGGDFILQDDQQGLSAQPTGKQGEVRELEPEADIPLIQRVVAEAASHIPVAELLASSSLSTKGDAIAKHKELS
jgi:hypothetical protein